MKKTTALILTLIIAFSSFSVISLAGGTQSPRIAETVYETDDIVIADIVATEAPYNADNTGVTDCTEAIQQAVNDCAANGGGTVFLPVGKYRLTGNIRIEQFVTLMGDWQDPDEGNDYGTLIIADVKSEDVMSPGLITVGASAGAVGLTVWYPNQSIDNVQPYPFTFYIQGNGDYMLQTVKNCTLINSYRGIGACAECENGIGQCHEMLTVENLKGTCLYQGMDSYNSADVDTYKTVYFLNKYWAEAGQEYNAPDIEKLNAYTRENCTGMVIGDLEWPEFCNIKISDCKYGINFRKGYRYTFSGSFRDLYITDCDYGFYVSEDGIYSRGKQWGTAIHNGVIEGSVTAIYDTGDNYLGLTNVEIKGGVIGNNIKQYTTVVGAAELDYSHKHSKPVSELFVVAGDKTGKTDISAELQKKLDEAGVTGGIVYLPGGLYRIDKPVTVPDGVELRGSSSVATRCQSGNSNGTLLISYYGYSESDEPLITLGKNSGISGIRIDYPLNNPTDDSGDYIKTSPCVYGQSDGMYIINSYITLCSRGVLFENADNVYIKRLVGCCAENMITLNGCTESYIEGCLQNGNTFPRVGYTDFDIPELTDRMQEANVFKYFFEPVSRKNADYIILNNSDGITIFNTFIYGGRSFLVENNSTSTLVNVGSDGSSKTAYTFNLNGGYTKIINSMRSTSDGQQSNKLYTCTDRSGVVIFNSQAVDISYNEYPVIKNVAGRELSEEDRIFVNVQPLFNVIYKLICVLIGLGVDIQ